MLHVVRKSLIKIVWRLKDKSGKHKKNINLIDTQNKKM